MAHQGHILAKLQPSHVCDFAFGAGFLISNSSHANKLKELILIKLQILL